MPSRAGLPMTRGNSRKTKVKGTLFRTARRYWNTRLHDSCPMGSRLLDLGQAALEMELLYQRIAEKAVSPSGMAYSRYTVKAILKSFAQQCSATFEALGYLNILDIVLLEKAKTPIKLVSYSAQGGGKFCPGLKTATKHKPATITVKAKLAPKFKAEHTTVQFPKEKFWNEKSSDMEYHPIVLFDKPRPASSSS